MPEISAKNVKALRDQTGAGMMDCKRALTDADGEVARAIELLRERGLAKAGKRAGRMTSEGAVGIALEKESAGIAELGCETDFVAKTDDFQSLVSEIAGVLAADPEIRDVEQALTAPLGEGSVGDRIQATISRVGENIELKRVARLGVEDGLAGGYLHPGGKLGVIIALQSSKTAEQVAGLAKDLAMHVAAADPTPVAVNRNGVPTDLIEREQGLLRRQAEQSGKPAKLVDRIVEGRIQKFLSEVCLLKQSFVKDPDRTVGEIVEQVADAAGGEIRVTGFTRFKLGEASES